MTLLAAMRWTLVASIIVYASAFVIGGELGVLIGIIGAYAMPVAALACVVIQIVTLVGRKSKSVEKPE